MNWPHDFVAEVRCAILCIDMPDGHWGASNKAVLAYLKRARPLWKPQDLIDRGTRQDIFTEKFLHTTPLGPRQELEYTKPQLDAWAGRNE